MRLRQAGGTLGTWWIPGVVPSAGRRALEQVQSIVLQHTHSKIQTFVAAECHLLQMNTETRQVRKRRSQIWIPGPTRKMWVGVRNPLPSAATVVEVLANKATARRRRWPAAVNCENAPGSRSNAQPTSLSCQTALTFEGTFQFITNLTIFFGSSVTTDVGYDNTVLTKVVSDE